MEEISFQGEEQKEGKNSPFPRKADLNKPDPTRRNTFNKSEHLKSFNSIRRIFRSGHTVRDFPITVRWISEDSAEPEFLIGFSVPKRHFPKAKDRNFIKRRLREAYRLNKYVLSDRLKTPQIHSIMFIYGSNKCLGFEEIQSKLISCLMRLAKSIDGND